jgi:GT2 family glycosyltransferase
VTRLSIVIVSYNASGDLATALAALVSTPPSCDHEIIVVDNASSDGAAAMVRQRFPTVTAIDAGRNSGFAAANNIGIRASHGDLVLLLNPDTIVPPGAIDSLAARLAERPDAGVIGPRIVDGHGHAELSFGSDLSPFGELRRKTLLALDGRGLAAASRFIERATSRERDVDWVTGACLLVRRPVAEEAGLLDERYFLYAEDADFCATVRARGHRVVFSPVAQIVHLRGRSAPSAGGAAHRAWQQSHLTYYRKHRPGWALWLERYLRLRGLPPDA